MNNWSDYYLWGRNGLKTLEIGYIIAGRANWRWLKEIEALKSCRERDEQRWKENLDSDERKRKSDGLRDRWPSEVKIKACFKIGINEKKFQSRHLENQIRKKIKSIAKADKKRRQWSNIDEIVD